MLEINGFAAQGAYISNKWVWDTELLSATARILIALMSCRGCELAALITTMFYTSEKLLNKQLNSRLLSALWKQNLFGVF